jgi:hypothetical protein
MSHTAPRTAACAIAALLAAALLAAATALAGEEPLPAFGDTWHPLTGTSLRVSAFNDSRFVCDFERGADSSSGPEVKALAAEGTFGAGPFGRAMKVERLAYPGAALIDVEQTYFGFWLRLEFDPATDAQRRVIMQMGDGARRSLVMRTDGKGRLVLLLSDDDYASACRTDISRWQPREWHHVAGWFHRKGHRLWLMVDGYGADSTVMYHNDGLIADDLGTL